VVRLFEAFMDMRAQQRVYPVWTAFPSSDYYGDSVAFELAFGRPSRGLPFPER
jgi:hypothetical protein